MKNESRWMNNKPLCIFIVAVVSFSVLILPWVIVIFEPDYREEVESILNKYKKDDRYVIVYDNEIFRFSDHEFDISDFKTNLKTYWGDYFIDSSLVYFYGSKKVGDERIVKLLCCDHYGQNLSVIFEKSYKNDDLSEKDYSLNGYNFYIKHHSGKKEDKSSYAVDEYNIENGEFKTMLYGEEAYNFQVEVNMYKLPNGETGVYIDQEMVNQTELAMELKEKKIKLQYLNTCYRNNEIYASCHIYTKSRYFKVIYKYNKQTGQLEFTTWSHGHVKPSDILKIDL